MVSAFRVDALRDPTEELRSLYLSSSTSDVEDFPRHVSRHFSRVFQSADAFREIAALDVRNPPEAHADRSLVRFRAMVQDTSPSQEMYLSKTKSGKLGGWGMPYSSDDEGDEVEYEHLRECTVIWAVSVPGESTWSVEELSGEINAQSSHSHKPTRPYKYPGHHDAHLGVQIKLYDGSAAESLKSTDIATFVGILTNEPFGSDLDSQMEAPTLHVLYIRTDSLNAVTRPYPYQAFIEDENAKDASGIVQIRDQLIGWIADEALGGDRDAAEWVLLISIARVLSHNPSLIQPSLTLSQFPSPPVPIVSVPEIPQSSMLTPTLSHILSTLLPITTTLPLTLSMLNSIPFAPESKDEDLHAGALQLPKGTVLLVTENGVREGKLVERGVMNIQALQELMSSQTLTYDFPFSKFSFPTDISCIVLSEGKKSAFFKTDITVPFKPKSSNPVDVSNLYKSADSIKMPSADRLAAFRNLIVSAICGKVTVEETLSEYIQQDFVRERRQNNSITSDDLIRRMAIAKLYALSLHCSELTVDVWERAKAFDERRREKLSP